MKKEREQKEREEKERKAKEEKERKEKEERERAAEKDRLKQEQEKKLKEEKDKEKRASKTPSVDKADKSPQAVLGKGEEGLKTFLLRMGREVCDDLYPKLMAGGVTSVEALSQKSFSELRTIGFLYGDCTYVMGCLKNWYPELFAAEPPKAATQITVVKVQLSYFSVCYFNFKLLHIILNISLYRP